MLYYILLLSFLGSPTTSLATTPATSTPVVVRDEPPAKVETIDDKIKRYANAYGQNEKQMKAVILCESGASTTVHNKSDPHGGAKGVSQFLQPTFNYYAPKAGIKNPDIWNVDQQLQTMAYMWKIGEQGQWTCYRDLFDKPNVKR